MAWSGRVESLHRCPEARAPMQPMQALVLREGYGIEGDRYALGTAPTAASRKRAGRSRCSRSRRWTPCCAITASRWPLRSTGRNVTVSGVPLNHLVGRRLRIGDTVLEATRLSIPCRYIEEITGQAIFKPLMHRSGLNCRILHSGLITAGAEIVPA